MSVRVLVVDDSLTLRKRISGALAARPGFEVVGEAEDGRQAIALCQALRPDVMTLDMMMPLMSGLAVTEHVMAYCPTPILIVSASTNRGELFNTYDALAAGAVDVLDKSGGYLDAAWEESLVTALRVVARVKVITHVRGRLKASKAPAAAAALPRPAPGSNPLRAVAIGASTGGPGAVLALLKSLPPDFPLPILLVLHLAPAFGQALADWLDAGSPLRVAFAQDGETLPSAGQGRVLLAPPGQHLTLRHGRLWLDQGPERHFCRPSVDVLFESLAKDLGPASAACLLTGMGSDGAAGLLALRQAGAVTIAQDEASCVVYGMPRAAVRLKAVDHLLSLGQIAPFLALSAAGGSR